MNKVLETVELDNGVLVEFFPQGNRYFGDYHRLQINVVATIPVDTNSLPVDLINPAANHSGFIKYKKTLERMGVATNQIDTATRSMIDDFIKTVGCYLENKNFAEYLLRKSVVSQPHRNRFSL